MKKNVFKITFLTSLGAGLEYYDFVIYGLMATYLSQLFFPKTDPSAALIQTWIIFSIGYLARPVGGVIFGLMGDRFGRKFTFLTAMLMMGISTLIIGLSPTHQQIGFLATAILFVCRIFQGAAFGAEVPGAVTFLSEHATKERRGLLNGFMISSLSVGSILGSITVYLLTKFLQNTKILAWGWRIPFLLGSVLALFSYYIRKKLQETPAFLQMPKHEHTMEPLKKLIQKHFKQVLQAIGILIFSSCFIIFVIFLPAFLNHFFQYEMKDIYLSTIAGIAVTIVLIPFFGWLSDYVGRKYLLLSAAIVSIFSCYFLFQLITHQTLIALYSFMILCEILISALAACYMTMMPEIFPARVRYTGIAMAYNVVFCISGSFPTLATYIMKATHDIKWIAFIFMGLAFITIISARSVPNRTRQELLV